MNIPDLIKATTDGEERRKQSLLHSDVPAMAALLAEKFTYVHASGKADDKASFLTFLGSGVADYLDIKTEREVVHPLGDSAAFMSGLITVTVIHHGERKTLRNRFAAAWTEEAGVLRLLHWQVTATPD